MEATNPSYTLNMYSFKTENPSLPNSIPESSLATLEIRIMGRYIIRLQLNQQHQQQQQEEKLCGDHLHDDDDDDVLDVEHVVSPVFSQCVAIPPHVLALLTLRKLCVTEALQSFGGGAEGAPYESLIPYVERFVGEAAEALGFKEFGGGG